jgi:hypothetical protein
MLCMVLKLGIQPLEKIEGAWEKGAEENAYTGRVRDEIREG